MPTAKTILSQFVEEQGIGRVGATSAAGSTTTLVADRGRIALDTWHHVAATYDGAAVARVGERGEIVGESLGQHREGLRRRVDGGRVGARPLVDRTVALHGRVDVGHRDQQAHRGAVERLRNGELVEVGKAPQPIRHDEEQLIASARQARDELERLFEQDRAAIKPEDNV